MCGIWRSYVQALYTKTPCQRLQGRALMVRVMISSPQRFAKDREIWSFTKEWCYSCSGSVSDGRQLLLMFWYHARADLGLPIRGDSGVKTLKPCNPREWLAVFRDDRGTPLDSGGILFSRTHATPGPFDTPFNVAIILAREWQLQ